VHYYRLYKQAKARNWLYDQTLMIVAEVDHMYGNQFDYPDDWDDLRDHGYADHNDLVIHMWLEQYHNEMFMWLQERHYPWRGVQNSDSEFGKDGIIRAYLALCIALRDPQHIIEFKLTWG